jgi:hypothetical protein
LILALVGGGWPASHPDRFTPRERGHGTHWIGGWVGHRTGLNKNSCPNCTQTLTFQSSSPQPPALVTALSWLPPTFRYEDNIKVHLQEIGWSDMAHYRAQWCAPVSIAMSLQSHKCQEALG